jgi:hypothetical protein
MSNGGCEHRRITQACPQRSEDTLTIGVARAIGVSTCSYECLAA